MKKNSKKKLMSRDVQIHLLMGDLPTIKAAAKAGKLSLATAKRALKDLGALGADISQYKEMVATVFPDMTESREGRGRPSPVAGEVREYRIQSINGGPPFIRLPVCVMGLEKTAKVKVRFNKKRIAVSV